MQFISIGDNLHEISEPLGKLRTLFHMLSELFTQLSIENTN